ncbi:MAG: tRNA (adenosine(37)-N6)-dimethylallyltransferase MiaA [Sedimentitalea sp.]
MDEIARVFNVLRAASWQEITLGANQSITPRGPLPPVPPDQPILIAGATASGKSALALRFAQEQGGVVINADASQVYDCWQVITARPTLAEMSGVPHYLYGHHPWNAPYSAGHWLREVRTVLQRPERAILVGGTGLYFAALTQGMADIPHTPPAIRTAADGMTLEQLLAQLDAPDSLDIQNRARVQRAWEVQQATGRSLHDWQRDTPAPLLAPDSAFCLRMQAPRDWLNARIEQRFDHMLAQGALDEVAAMRDVYDTTLPAFRAIGVPELMAHLAGEITLGTARDRATLATRQFAKRQRTWLRSKMAEWQAVELTDA